MSFIKRFNAMIIMFLGLIVFSRANTNVSNDNISSTGPFYYCSLDSEFQFGEHIYSRADSTTSYKQEKLIGFLIREEDENQIIKQEGYLYGIVSHFYVYDYSENYLPVYSIVGEDDYKYISVQLGDFSSLYVNNLYY